MDIYFLDTNTSMIKNRTVYIVRMILVPPLKFIRRRFVVVLCSMTLCPYSMMPGSPA